MHEGRAEQVATPMEIWRAPANTYVAGFIGAPAMNFLAAELAEGGGAAKLKAGATIAFADGVHPGGDGTPLTIGIRPEHIQAGSGPGSLALKVDLVEPLGAESLIHGALPSGEALTVRMSDCAPLAGSVLPVVLPPTNLHVFDAEGRRIEAVRRRERTAAAGAVGA
jgi:sn-glycerol 3-phosphate transport system ATP-binding protein